MCIVEPPADGSRCKQGKVLMGGKSLVNLLDPASVQTTCGREGGCKVGCKVGSSYLSHQCVKLFHMYQRISWMKGGQAVTNSTQTPHSAV